MAEPQKKQTTIDDVMGQLSTLQREVKKATERKPTPQAQQKIVSAGEKSPVDIKGLPDPVMDSEGFNRALLERLDQEVERRFAKRDERASQQTSQATKAEKLWKQFEKKYPKYAKNRDITEFAASRVVRDLTEEGEDAEAFIEEDRDGFFERIISKVDSSFKGVINSDDDEDDEKGGDQEDEGQGYASLFGGDSGKGKKKGKQDSDDSKEPEGGIVSILRKRQLESGYY